MHLIWVRKFTDLHLIVINYNSFDYLPTDIHQQQSFVRYYRSLPEVCGSKILLK